MEESERRDSLVIVKVRRRFTGFVSRKLQEDAASASLLVPLRQSKAEK